jgi:hypothetical protein
MALSASIKVCDPLSMPASFLADLGDLRSQLERLRQENERLRQDNERLQRELARAKAELDETRRASKRQAAPFAKGPAKAQPKTPGRKRGAAYGRQATARPRRPNRLMKSSTPLFPTLVLIVAVPFGKPMLPPSIKRKSLDAP